jgi:serine protease
MIKALLLTMLGMALSQNSLAAFKKEPGPHGMYIAEWDLAFPDLATLQKYMQNKNSNKLIISTMGSSKTFDVWSASDRKKLAYCISDEFGDKKKDVIDAMRVATRDWMDAAGVKFIYRRSEDKNCTATNTKVMFDVRPVNEGMYLARAFFPSYDRPQRNVLIDQSSFDFSFVALSGFLRHELGHVLGFRHEHISPEGNGKCKELPNFKPLTDYDQYSVMHYPQCGGKNELENMILSDLDKDGAQKVYPSK